VRFRMCALGLLGALLLPSANSAAEGPATIDLGGLRHVQAVVSLEDGQYTVRVRMLPVTCFDAVTNARVNRDKGEGYAFQALARHLSAEKSVQMEVSGARVAATGRDGKFFTLTLQVPRTGVKLLREGEAPANAPRSGVVQRVAFDAPFFTRKRDYLHTAEWLAAGLNADLRAAESKAGPDEKRQAAFALAVAELEERGDDLFQKLRSEVEEDKLLLAVEREEVLGDLARRQAAWLEALRKAVARQQPNPREKP
jgi:hypothetical protein